jgi:hypothetical protein
MPIKRLNLSPYGLMGIMLPDGSTVQPKILQPVPLPEYAKDMPFKGVCPVGEILQINEV